MKKKFGLPVEVESRYRTTSGSAEVVLPDRESRFVPGGSGFMRSLKVKKIGIFWFSIKITKNRFEAV